MNSTGLITVLTAIRDERGALTPPLVVDAATPVDHPLHSYFEWDDSIAGPKYREAQAAQLLRVTFRPDPTQPDTLRAFVNVRGQQTRSGVYVPVEEAMMDDLTRRIVLADMNREWVAFKRRYEHMAEFATLVLNDVRKDVS